MRPSRLRSTFLALVLPTARATAAWAGDAPLTVASAEARYEQAVATAQAGDYAKAAELFDDLLKQLPTNHALRTLALYGAARSYEEVGTPESACNAIHRFKRMLRRADADAEKRATAERAMKDLSSKCDRVAASKPVEGELTPERQTVILSAAAIALGGILVMGLVAAYQ